MNSDWAFRVYKDFDQLTRKISHPNSFSHIPDIGNELPNFEEEKTPTKNKKKTNRLIFGGTDATYPPQQQPLNSKRPNVFPFLPPCTAHAETNRDFLPLFSANRKIMNEKSVCAYPVWIFIRVCFHANGMRVRRRSGSTIDEFGARVRSEWKIVQAP